MNQSVQPGQLPLVIYGGGGHGLVVAEAAIAAGWQIAGFLDDDHLIQTVGQWPVLEKSSIQPGRVGVIVAIGDNQTRCRVCEQLCDANHLLASVVHPNAWVSPTAQIGPEVYIGPQAVINAQARIDTGVIINSAATIEHHGHIKAYAHIGPGASLGALVQVGQLSLIGVGASVKPSMSIGDNCIVGAGASVVKDIAAQSIVGGVPAKPLANSPD